MPFHHHQHSHSSSRDHGAVHGLFEVAQTLGSIGAPTGNLRTAALGTTTAGTDALLPSNTSSVQHPDKSTLPPPQNAHSSLDNSFDGSRRSNTIGRMAEHSSYQSSPHIQDPQSPSNLYASHPSASSLPGSLQPGSGQARPGPGSSYTAPSGVPQINTNASQYSLPTRSNTMHAHSHSRSSPSGMEQQKYVVLLSARPSTHVKSSQDHEWSRHPFRRLVGDLDHMLCAGVCRVLTSYADTFPSTAPAPSSRSILKPRRRRNSSRLAHHPAAHPILPLPLIRSDPAQIRISLRKSIVGRQYLEMYWIGRLRTAIT